MNLTVRTKAGQIEGLHQNHCRIFKGVPYAEPPVGQLRFCRPQPKKPWTGVRPAKAFGPKAYQADLTKDPFYGKEFYFGETQPMSEDCLYLNIWAPESGEKLPVLLWIHGGAFLHGSGVEAEFDGEGFAAKGVILVTINYRVGALGFFTHEDLEGETDGVSGNYGLWDQIAALKWVHENIGAFGGDPEKITVAGQSAGCMSTQCLVSSEETRGLIHGAILQSGGGIPGIPTDYGREKQILVSKRLMEHLGVSTIEELRALSPEAVTYGAYEISPDFGGLCWTPNVDGRLLKDTPASLAKAGRVQNIPYIIGSTADDLGGEAAGALAESAKSFAAARAGKAPVYVYYFNRRLPGDDAGAFHSCELWYEFETMKRCWRPFTPHDYEISAELSGYFANFVKTGDPNGGSLPHWPAFDGVHEFK